MSSCSTAVSCGAIGRKGRERAEGKEKGVGAALIVTVPGYCSHSSSCKPLRLGLFYHIMAREQQLRGPFSI